MERALTMQALADLDDVLQSRSHVRVLRALAGLPRGFPASVRELARRSGVAHPTASRVLSALADYGIAITRRYGRADMYELNREHRLHDPLSALLQTDAEFKTDLAGFLAKELPLRLPRVRQAYLFGSAVRDDLRRGSDIDLALIAPGAAHDLESGIAQLGESVRARFGRRLSVVADTPLDDARKPRRRGRDLWNRIAREGLLIFDRKER